MPVHLSSHWGEIHLPVLVAVLNAFSDCSSSPSLGLHEMIILQVHDWRHCVGTNDAAKTGKPLTEDEGRALAAREAARQRVQMRTAQGFGLGL